jgi:hypothetical protein
MTYPQQWNHEQLAAQIHEAVTQLQAAVTPLQAAVTPPAPAGPPPAPQRMYANPQYSQVSGMTPAQIEAALKGGHLQALLAGDDPAAAAVVPAEGQLGDAHLKAMTPEQVASAHEAGRFADMLSSPPPAG